MSSQLATRIAECSLTLGSAPNALPKSPCPNSPKRPAESTAGNHAVRHATRLTPQPTTTSAGSPPARSSDACRLGAGQTRRAACAANRRIALGSASRVTVSTVQYSDLSARSAAPLRRCSGSGTTPTGTLRPTATGDSPGRTASRPISTRPCSLSRMAFAPSAGRTKGPYTAVLACRSICPSTTTTALDRSEDSSARGVIAQSVSLETTPPWRRERRNTFCAIRKSQQNRGGQSDCPPREIGGQSIGD